MEWRGDFHQVQVLAAEGNLSQAIEIAHRLALDKDAISDPAAVLWIFHAACKATEPDLAHRMARALERFSGDEESFTAASWLKNMAIETFKDGEIERSSDYLTRALCVAPKHRKKLLSDPRLAGLLSIERDPSPTPMSKEVRRTIREAESLYAQRKYEKALELLGTLANEDANRIEVIRVIFNVTWHAQINEAAHSFAAHMSRGNVMDRLLAGEWYLTYAVLLRKAGPFVEAVNVINEGLNYLPEFRGVYSKDPRLGGIMLTPGVMN